MKLFLWYLAFCFLVLPLPAALFTGGLSLMVYLSPVFILMGKFEDGFTFLLGAIVPAILFWSVHQFFRFTLRYNLRRQQFARRGF